MPFLYLGYIPHHPTVFLNLGYKPVSSKDGWVYNLPGLSHEFKISTSRMDSSADTARLLKSWGMGRGLKAKAPVPAPRVGDWPGAPGVLGQFGGLNMTQHSSSKLMTIFSMFTRVTLFVLTHAHPVKSVRSWSPAETRMHLDHLGTSGPFAPSSQRGDGWEMMRIYHNTS